MYEITTYRSEEGYKDHRHPDTIRWGSSLKEDLSRRDFTINAIASDGKGLIDPYEGQKDLAAKVIRTVGVAKERFAEDALRMMRAVRIASELGFTIENEAMEAIRSSAQLLRPSQLSVSVMNCCARSVHLIPQKVFFFSDNQGYLSLFFPN